MFNVQPSEERFSMFGHNLILRFEPSPTNNFEYYLINSYDGEVIEMWVERPTMGEVALAVEAWIEYCEIDADEWLQEMIQGPTPEDSLSYLDQVQIGDRLFLVDHVPFFVPEFPFPLGVEVIRAAHLPHDQGGEIEWLTDEELDGTLAPWDGEGSVVMRQALEMMVVR